MIECLFEEKLLYTKIRKNKKFWKFLQKNVLFFTHSSLKFCAAELIAVSFIVWTQMLEILILIIVL